MKADPFAQLKLLDVQELDSRADQLEHRLRTMPETAELSALNESRADVEGRAKDAQVLVDDLTRAQRKADADVEQVKARRTRDQNRIDQGTVTNPKDLERLQHELVSLNRRITDLEDVELEVMEQLETAQSQLDELTTRATALDGEITQARGRRDERAGQLRDELGDVRAERDQAAAGMPEDLMTLYTKLRAQKGGVGAAALRARQCGGCRLTLNAADLSAIAKKPSDEVVRCEECNRILVRTSESGI